MKAFVFSVVMFGGIMQTAYAQSAASWSMGPAGFKDDAMVRHGTSNDQLKAVIRKHNIFTFLPAVRVLVGRTGEQERSFVLEQAAQLAADSTIVNFWSLKTSVESRRKWSCKAKYVNQLIRGHFGEPGAMAAMDSIATFCDGDGKVDAIDKLAEVGIYNYFNVIESALQRNPCDANVLYALRSYGKSQVYRDQAGDLVENCIQSDETFPPKDNMYALLGSVDSARMIRVLERDVIDPTKGDRLPLFYWLLRLNPDPQNQIRLLREYLPTESIAQNRSLAFGELDQYPEADLIQFAREWRRIEQSPDVIEHLDVITFGTYLPSVPDSTSSTQSVLDSLRTTLQKSVRFNWIGSSDLAAELNGYLIAAKSRLNRGQQRQAAAQVQQFQKKIAEAYTAIDSAVVAPTGATRFVTEDGYRFLWYGAQYILDRLGVQADTGPATRTGQPYRR